MKFVELPVTLRITLYLCFQEHLNQGTSINDRGFIDCHCRLNTHTRSCKAFGSLLFCKKASVFITNIYSILEAFKIYFISLFHTGLLFKKHKD